jgi:hypothetical protein
MGDGNVLHPAQIRDVVDVAQFVDIGRFHRNGKFEGRWFRVHAL